MIDLRRATKAQLKSEHRRLGAVVQDNYPSGWRSFQQMAKVLEPDERVTCITTGLVESITFIIALTDRRVLFVNKSCCFKRMAQIDIGLDKIVSVGASTGMMSGVINLSSHGKTLEITHVPKKAITPFVAKVKEQIKIYCHQESTPATAPDSGADKIAALEKLALMKEKGVLTDEEFQQQKEKLLKS